MSFNTVKLILSDCERHELRDHSFGDVEVNWYKGDVTIAYGYFSRSSAEVRVYRSDNPNAEFPSYRKLAEFTGDQAHELRLCGEIHVSRNDETGPDEFTLGEIQPGLSKGDVYHELTGEYMDEPSDPWDGWKGTPGIDPGVE